MRKAEHSRRLAALFDAMDNLRVGGGVLDDRDDIHYLTGYTGSDAALVLAAGKRRGWLVTDSRYQEEAEKTAPGVETILWRGDFAAFVGKTLNKFRAKTVGHTPATLRVAFFEALQGGGKTARKWLDLGGEISRIRSVKSAGEIAAIEASLACAQAAFTAARTRWRPGMTEIEVKNDLEWEMRRRGAEDAAFETIVAVGANASLPHAHAGTGKIRPGKMLLVDFGARVGRYNSDLTRTLWQGDIPRLWRRRLQAVLAAQAAGTETIRAGVPGSVPDAAARSALADFRLADYFTHSLGHGLGLAVHEEPRLSGRSEKLLAAGNVVTVEPGVYFPELGGIRIEDMVLVTEEGRRVLSTLPKDPESLIF